MVRRALTFAVALASLGLAVSAPGSAKVTAVTGLAELEFVLEQTDEVAVIAFLDDPSQCQDSRALLRQLPVVSAQLGALETSVIRVDSAQLWESSEVGLQFDSANLPLVLLYDGRLQTTGLRWEEASTVMTPGLAGISSQSITHLVKRHLLPAVTELDGAQALQSFAASLSELNVVGAYFLQPESEPLYADHQWLSSVAKNIYPLRDNSSVDEPMVAVSSVKNVVNGGSGAGQVVLSNCADSTILQCFTPHDLGAVLPVCCFAQVDATALVGKTEEEVADWVASHDVALLGEITLVNSRRYLAPTTSRPHSEGPAALPLPVVYLYLPLPAVLTAAACAQGEIAAGSGGALSVVDMEEVGECGQDRADYAASFDAFKVLRECAHALQYKGSPMAFEPRQVLFAWTDTAQYPDSLRSKSLISMDIADTSKSGQNRFVFDHNLYTDDIAGMRRNITAFLQAYYAKTLSPAAPIYSDPGVDASQMALSIAVRAAVAMVLSAGCSHYFLNVRQAGSSPISVAGALLLFSFFPFTKCTAVKVFGKSSATTSLVAVVSQAMPETLIDFLPTLQEGTACVAAGLLWSGRFSSFESEEMQEQAILLLIASAWADSSSSYFVDHVLGVIESTAGVVVTSNELLFTVGLLTILGSSQSWFPQLSEHSHLRHSWQSMYVGLCSVLSIALPLGLRAHAAT